jgi:sulfonate transport system permease protein
MSEAASPPITLLDAPRIPRLSRFAPARASLARFRRFATPVLLVLAWQAGVSFGVIPSHLVASPAAILETLWSLSASGELLENLLVSLGRVAVGLGIGVVAGVGFALLAGLSRIGEDAVDAPLQMGRTLPHLALVPLFILWFGIGETPKIALIGLATTFPIYLNLYNGIRGVDPKLIEAARSFGLRGWSLIADVVLPGALPSFLLGLRYALAGSWLTLVVAEQINASAGLGYLINNARDFSRTDEIVVCLMVYALLGLTADAIVRMLERKALAWRPSFIKS